MVTELAQENIESKQLAHGNDKEIKQNSEQHKLLLLRSLIESKDPSAKVLILSFVFFFLQKFVHFISCLICI